MGKTLYSIADLSQTYKGKLTSWNRGIALIDKQRVLVQDEIAPAQTVDVAWNFHTFANVEIAKDGRFATLTQNGSMLQVHILKPAEAHFTTASIKSAPPQEPNSGLTNLVILLPKQSTPQTVAILFTKSGDKAAPQLTPLSAWK